MSRNTGGVVRQGSFARVPRPGADPIQRPTGARAISQPGIDDLVRLDPSFAAELEERLEHARSAGYDRGFAEGLTRAEQRISDLSSTIASSAAALADLDDRSRRQATAALVDLAVTVATKILDRNPHDEGAALANRLQTELESLPAGPVTIETHPDDVAMVAKALPSEGIVVSSDPTLQPGEARLRGEWVMADMTREAGWETVRRIIEDISQQG